MLAREEEESSRRSRFLPSSREVRPASPLAVAPFRLKVLDDLSAKITPELAQAPVRSGCTQADLWDLPAWVPIVNPIHIHHQLLPRVLKDRAADGDRDQGMGEDCDGPEDPSGRS